MRNDNSNLEQASTQVLDMVAPFGGRGGLISVMADGRVSLDFQTTLMYRGTWKENQIEVGIGPESI